MRRIAFVLAAALAIASGGAFAQGDKSIEALTSDDFELESAKQLVTICTLDRAHPNYRTAKGFCYGYISGGGHFHREVSRDPEFDSIICPGDKVTHEDVVKVFVAFTRDNPQYLDKPAMDVLFRAAGNEWPC